MKERIKKLFPRLYELHTERLRRRYLNQLKNMSLEEQKAHLAEVYKTCIGKTIDWDNPVTYTEKMQWSKFYDRTPLKAKLADKYEVKRWISQNFGDRYLVPLLGVWDSFDEIDFDLLPDQFVLKTNHYSGTNMIIREKKSFNKKDARKKFNKWMKMDCAYNSMELHYADIQPKIIAEAIIENGDHPLIDYSFFCFDGEPYCFFGSDHARKARNFYDMNYQLLNWKYDDDTVVDPSINMVPANIDEMIAFSRQLSQGFQQVRVDLYLCGDRMYFGEMTFTSFSGLCKFIPESVDYQLGSMWKHRPTN